MNSLVICSVLLILCNFVSHLYVSVLTLLHIAIYSVLDEFHIQSYLRGYWIGECMCVCMYVCKQSTSLNKRQSLIELRVFCIVTGEWGKKLTSHIVLFQFVGTFHGRSKLLY
jgi:hypothetical protein